MKFCVGGLSRGDRLPLGSQSQPVLLPHGGIGVALDGRHLVRDHRQGPIELRVLPAAEYEVFVPENWSPKQKWPIILFLHGAGERGEDGLFQTQVGIGKAIREHRDRFPAIVVLPQCHKNIWWAQSPMDDIAIASLEAATKEFHGDKNRTYLTGLSMGGYGAWYLAGKYPGRFAAIARARLLRQTQRLARRRRLRSPCRRVLPTVLRR